MTDLNKDAQLQIRVSPEQKAMIVNAAKRAGMTMSAWLLARALPARKVKFQQLLEVLQINEHDRNGYAELNDLLTELSPRVFNDVVAEKPVHHLTSFARNYVAAMVELAASQKDVNPPAWVWDVKALAIPYFGTGLNSLRLYLLTHSPAVFRRRNIFIDASLGDRV